MNRRARECRDSRRAYSWCRCCNRLTNSSHDAFCGKHKKPRSKFMRRSSNATARIVEDKLIERITEIADDIASLYLRAAAGPDETQRANARKELRAQIKHLAALAKDLKSAPTHARADDLDDLDYLIT